MSEFLDFNSFYRHRRSSDATFEALPGKDRITQARSEWHSKKPKKTAAVDLRTSESSSVIHPASTTPPPPLPVLPDPPTTTPASTGMTAKGKKLGRPKKVGPPPTADNNIALPSTTGLETPIRNMSVSQPETIPTIPTPERKQPRPNKWNEFYIKTRDTPEILGLPVPQRMSMMQELYHKDVASSLEKARVAAMAAATAAPK
jgi:hypothetical protein